MLNMLQLDLQQTRIISLQMKTESALTRRLWCEIFVDILMLVLPLHAGSKRIIGGGVIRIQ